jgi:molybdopterin molybdotransferase
MITVEEATQRVVAAFAPLSAEGVALAEAHRRVLAEDVTARFDQPPHAVSAMDGYALKAADAARAPATLEVIGEAPAGRPFGGNVGPGQAVRIFTGGVMPDGSDSVAIQEDTERSGNRVTIREAVKPAQNVRAAGLDFRAGEAVVAKGRRLSGRDLSLIAAADAATVSVARKPVVAIVATGDELSRPGEARKPGGIVSSSTYGLAAMIETWGGVPRDLGIIPDRADAFADLRARTQGADLIVTLGGASVGDHDLVQSALAPHGFALDFWKIAMRPGKPLIFGRLGDTPLLGLPGNPVSAMVCAVLFLRPAIAAMLGAPTERPRISARAAAPLRPNGPREDYIRARILWRDGEAWVEPFSVQDSSMQKIFARADALIVRAIRAPAAQAGERVSCLLLGDC